MYSSILPTTSISLRNPRRRALSSLNLTPRFAEVAIFAPPPSTSRPDFTVRMGGGPRTFPGGVTKWQWKRMQERKSKQLLKARLSRERQLYEMRKRAELKAAVAELERPWDTVKIAPTLFSAKADEQLKTLADRFLKPGGFDMWSEKDGPQVFKTPDALPSPRYFPKGAVQSVKPYGLITEGTESDLAPGKTDGEEATWYANRTHKGRGNSRRSRDGDVVDISASSSNSEHSEFLKSFSREREDSRTSSRELDDINAAVREKLQVGVARNNGISRVRSYGNRYGSVADSSSGGSSHSRGSEPLRYSLGEGEYSIRGKRELGNMNGESRRKFQGRRESGNKNGELRGKFQVGVRSNNARESVTYNRNRDGYEDLGVGSSHSKGSELKSSFGERKDRRSGRRESGNGNDDFRGKIKVGVPGSSGRSRVPYNGNRNGDAGENSGVGSSHWKGSESSSSFGGRQDSSSGRRESGYRNGNYRGKFQVGVARNSGRSRVAYNGNGNGDAGYSSDVGWESSSSFEEGSRKVGNKKGDFKGSFQVGFPRRNGNVLNSRFRKPRARLF